MRIITTFNGVLYRETGHCLLESLRSSLPDVPVLAYVEDMTDMPEGVDTVPVAELPEIEAIRRQCADIIPVEEGGAAEGLRGFNRRWFNWFRKVAAEHDAIVRRPYDGYTLFLDADVRVIRPFDNSTIAGLLRKPVGVFRGQREAVETGVIVFNERCPETRGFVTKYMDLFISQEFRQLKRWDDSYTMTVCADRHSELVQDFADGRKPVVHRNSNGHETGGQVLPLTAWGQYLEHDKGVHWRRGFVSPVAGVRLRRLVAHVCESVKGALRSVRPATPTERERSDA